MVMKKYPSELRERAVRLYRETTPRPTVSSVARKLGVGAETLRNWIKQDEADRGERNDLPTSAEREVVRQLRRENEDLKRVNEILRLASSFFASELDQTRRWS
jgi:transposase